MLRLPVLCLPVLPGVLPVAVASLADCASVSVDDALLDSDVLWSRDVRRPTARATDARFRLNHEPCCTSSPPVE